MKIAILGYGTVGRGGAQLMEERVPEVAVARRLALAERLSDARWTGA